MLERFQYFLLNNNGIGITLYERYDPFIARQVKYTHDYFAKNASFPKYVNFNNILGGVRNGDPLLEPILQFADFFAFAPYMKHQSNGKKRIDMTKFVTNTIILIIQFQSKEAITKYNGDPRLYFKPQYGVRPNRVSITGPYNMN